MIEYEKAYEDVFTKEHSKYMRKRLEDIIDMFSKCKCTAYRIKDQLYKTKHLEIFNVEHVRMTIDNHLDKIEPASY